MCFKVFIHKPGVDSKVRQKFQIFQFRVKAWKPRTRRTGTRRSSLRWVGCVARPRMISATNCGGWVCQGCARGGIEFGRYLPWNVRHFVTCSPFHLFHQIHEDLYDLSNFAAQHPGGRSWIEMTKGQVNPQFMSPVLQLTVTLVTLGKRWVQHLGIVQKRADQCPNQSIHPIYDSIENAEKWPKSL